MTASLSLTESQITTALGAFLMGILPSGVEVVRGLDNRVPEPKSDDYVEVIPLLRERLETNVEAYTDVAGVGSIAGATLTITEMLAGAFAVGQSLTGTGVSPNTSISALGTGTGGDGTYTITPAQTVASTVLQAGSKSSLQPIKITFQIDAHGPHSGDNAQIISTLLRDDYAVQTFAASGFDVAPLYVVDPRQLAFVNGEQQFEERWTIDAVLQANPIILTPMQFADEITIGIINTDAAYPPT